MRKMRKMEKHGEKVVQSSEFGNSDSFWNLRVISVS